MREVDSNGLVKILRAAGEGLAPEKPQKIAKIVATLEDNPLNAAIEYKTLIMVSLPEESSPSENRLESMPSALSLSKSTPAVLSRSMESVTEVSRVMSNRR